MICPDAMRITLMLFKEQTRPRLGGSAATQIAQPCQEHRDSSLSDGTLTGLAGCARLRPSDITAHCSCSP
jgi:hypothetical protein